MYHAIRFARTSSDAVQLGLEALTDRTKAVRYRACMLLAYSQRKDVLESVYKALEGAPSSTRDDIRATIDAGLPIQGGVNRGERLVVQMELIAEIVAALHTLGRRAEEIPVERGVSNTESKGGPAGRLPVSACGGRPDGTGSPGVCSDRSSVSQA